MSPPASQKPAYIWQSHYDKGIPATLEPYPQRTLLDYISESSTKWPDRPALKFKGAELSYRQLDRLSDSFAAALVEQVPGRLHEVTFAGASQANRLGRGHARKSYAMRTGG